MAPLSKHVKFSGNLRVFERLEVDEGALNVGRIVVLGLKQEGRRYLWGGLE